MCRQNRTNKSYASETDGNSIRRTYYKSRRFIAPLCRLNQLLIDVLCNIIDLVRTPAIFVPTTLTRKITLRFLMSTVVSNERQHTLERINRLFISTDIKLLRGSVSVRGIFE